MCVGQVTLSYLIGGRVSVLLCSSRLAGLRASGGLLSPSLLPMKVHTTTLGFFNVGSKDLTQVTLEC